MLRLATLLGLIGLAVATGVIVWSGYDQVLAALNVAGWGIVVTSLFHLIPMFFFTLSWQGLLPGKRKTGSVSFFFYLSWIRAAINNLMPVARVGGEVVTVRLMMTHGMKKSSAIACTVVETTLSVVAIFVFTMVGIAFFTLRIDNAPMQIQLIAATLLSVPIIVAMGVVQKIGLFGILDKIFTFMFRDHWKKIAGNTNQLDQAVRLIYRRHGRVLLCGVWQFLAWAIGATEIWLALYYLGHPVSLVDAIIVEALIQATSTAAFVVPGALGVQEAGFLLFGHMIGLTPDIAAALAVVRRCRDLILYVPGLVVWQIQEGRALLKKR